MTLGQPLWLGLALLALVLIYFHRQRRAQRAALVGSLHLWRRLALQSAPKARPKARLSAALLLQGLVLGLVALALARPGFGPAPGGDVLLLIEAGRAMRATDVRPERFGAAVTGALGDLGGRTSVLLVADWPVPLAVNRSDRAGIRTALREAAASDGTPDWAAAARTARALYGSRVPRVIVYASPGQAGAAREALSSLKAEIRVMGAAPPNAALTRFAVEPGTGNAPWTLSGAVRNFGPAGQRRLSVALDDRVLSTQILQLSGAGETPFTLKFTPGGGGVLSARLDAADVLPADDAAQVVLRPVPTPLRVALLGPPSSAPDDPARRGAAALPGAQVTRIRVPPAVGTADLLIVTDPALSPGDAPPPAPVTVWLNAQASVARPDSVLAWDSSTTLGQGVAWSDLGPLGRVSVPPWPAGSALLTGRGGPLIELRRRSGRTEVRVNVPLEGSDWTDTPAFPVFLANLARLAQPGAGARVVPPCQVGLPCAVAAGAGTLQPPGTGAAQRLVGSGASFVPWRIGVYRVDGLPVAVNRLSGADSDLRSSGGAAGMASSRPALLAGWRDLLGAAWRPLLALALLALLAELLILGRAEPTLRRGRWRALSRPQRRMLALHGVAGALLLLAVLGVRLPSPAPPPASARVVLPGAAPVAGQFTVWGGPNPSLAPLAGGPAGDLAAALQTAAASLPPFSPRTLQLQDGPWPVSARLPDVLAAFRSQGIGVVVEAAAPAPPLTLSAFETPAEVTPGQGFTAQVVVGAREAGPARLTLRRGDTPLLEVSVTLQAGLTRLTLPLEADRPGTAGYVLTLSRPGGAAVQAHAATRVTEAPVVLVVGPDAAARGAVARALALQGLSAQERPPESLTPEIVMAAPRITLLDTPAQALNPGVRTALEARVRSGGHLLIAGEGRAFGPGGYLGTTLETLSPLSGRVVRDLPRLALGLALDKSGSMNELVGGEVSKLDLIKSAALNSALLLSPQSEIAVVAFDSSPKLAVPLTRATNQELIRSQIGRIEAEGGTVVKRALEATLKELNRSAASRKHLILLTDGVDGGIFSPEEYRRLIRRIRATGITVSTVSVGSGMHTSLMRNIATWGEGRFAQAQDWRDVPSLLARDTLDLGRSAVQTGAFPARWPGGPAFTLAGYVRTTLKPGATALGQIGSGPPGAGPAADPLAATWRVGLGSVSALSVLPTAEGVSLADRPDFPALLAPLVRGPGPDESAARRLPSLIRDGADLIVTSATPTLSLDGPDGQRHTSLQPDGQGSYVGRLYAPPPGGYSVASAAGSVALGMPPPGGAVAALLPVSLSADQPTSWLWQPAWPILALLALCAFFGGLALRYLPERPPRRPEPGAEPQTLPGSRD